MIPLEPEQEVSRLKSTRASLISQLHEVTVPAAATCSVRSVSETSPLSPLSDSEAEPVDFPNSSSYDPPYKPRAKHAFPRSRQLAPLSPADSSTVQTVPDNFAITLHAALSRQPRDGPLPFSSTHIELSLAWHEPEWFKWIPGRKYVPAMNLAFVEGEKGTVAVYKKQNDRPGIVRGLVKGVVGSLPVVWRVAGWL